LMCRIEIKRQFHALIRRVTHIPIHGPKYTHSSQKVLMRDIGTPIKKYVTIVDFTVFF